MKWFSIDTNLINDDKIEDLLFRHGAEGYAVYVHLLEKIAKEIDIDNKNNGYINGIETVGRLAHSLYVRPEKMKEILDTCAELKLIEPKDWKNNKIYIPKMLKRKQVLEYLRSQEAGKKGANKRWKDSTPIKTPKSTPNDHKELDKELDKEVGTISIDRNKRNINSKVEKIKLHSEENLRSIELNPDYDICQHFLSYLTEYHPNKTKALRKGREDSQIYETWLNDLRILNDKGYTRDQILRCIKFAINNEFWRKRLNSLSILNRKNKDGDLYIAYFLDEIKNERKKEISKESLLKMMQ